MTWHIDGVGGGGGRIASEFWDTNIGLKGGWIDADPKDPKGKRIGDIESNDYGYYIFTRAIADLEDAIIENTGQRIDIDGYNRRPELPMTALSIKEVRYKLVLGIVEKIFKWDLVPEGDYESIFFTVAFGGGTGTGIINPVTEILRRRTGLSIYALGALTESKKYDEKNFPLLRRCFNTSWALRNLLIKTRRDGVDAVFLVDNDVLKGKREGKNRRIFESLFPMMNPRKLDEGFIGTDLRDKLTGGIGMPQIIVPCYYAANNDMEVRDLLDRAVKNKLMECDHTKADTIIVFTSLLSVEEKEEIVKWVKEETIEKGNEKISEEKIHVCRVWNSKREILMLLRNPYGSEKDPFYDRLSDIINNAKEYAIPGSKEKMVNPDILEGFNKDFRTKLSDFIINRLMPDLER